MEAQAPNKEEAGEGGGKKNRNFGTRRSYPVRWGLLLLQGESEGRGDYRSLVRCVLQQNRYSAPKCCNVVSCILFLFSTVVFGCVVLSVVI